MKFDKREFFKDDKNRKKFNNLRDILNEEIYKNIEYDRSKLDLIVRIEPTMVKINFQIHNSDFLDTYGYALYPNNDKDKTIIDLDQDVFVNRIVKVIDRINELNKENILEVIE